MLFTMILCFQMSSVVISRPHLRNIAILGLCIGSLLMLVFALGPQGIVPAKGMMSTNPNESSFKNLNLRSVALPVPNYIGGQDAPGVSIAVKSIEILVSCAVKNPLLIVTTPFHSRVLKYSTELLSLVTRHRQSLVKLYFCFTVLLSLLKLGNLKSERSKQWQAWAIGLLQLIFQDMANLVDSVGTVVNFWSF